MQISHDKLSTKKVVWYKYENHMQLMGPFRVVRFFSDYLGRHVILKEMIGKEERTVLLADDDDYGALLFHDKPVS